METKEQRMAEQNRVAAEFKLVKMNEFKAGQQYRLNGVKTHSTGTYIVTKVEISHYYDGHAVGTVWCYGTLTFKASWAWPVTGKRSFHINSLMDHDSTLI